MAITNVEKLIQRSEVHWTTAQDLCARDDEWAAVSGFYSCYQLIRAALVADPIFHDRAALERVHHAILPEDRYETKHSKGGLSKAAFGVNELVTELYRHVAPKYHSAHRASCDVRYEMGLPRLLTIERVMAYCDEIRAEYYSGSLVYTVARTLKP